MSSIVSPENDSRYRYQELKGLVGAEGLEPPTFAV
jgi:hypothetical protein